MGAACDADDTDDTNVATVRVPLPGDDLNNDDVTDDDVIHE